mgnify:FL=1
MPKTSLKNKYKVEEIPKAFAKEYLVNGLNATQALIKVKPHLKNKNSQYVMAHRLLSADNTQKAMKEILLGDSILLDKVYRNLHEIADAKLITTKDNQAIIHPDIPDYPERRKISHTILELIDAFPAHKIESKTLNLSLKYDGLSEDELIKQYEEKLKELRKK